MTGLEGLIPYLIGAAVYFALQYFGLVPKQPAPSLPGPTLPSPNPLLDELIKRLRELIASEQERAQQEASQRIIDKLGK
ncbi:MAG: hypothetical protein AB7K24_03375 [Gemmataceae bacterium]